MKKQINPHIKPYIACAIVVIILVIWLLAGCTNPLRHYQKVALDYPRNEEKRNILATVCKVEFPSNARKDSSTSTYTTIEKDTSANEALRDKIAELAHQLAMRPDCPQLNIDSVYEVLKGKMKPEVHTVTRTISVTETKIDSSTIKILQVQYGQLQSDYQKKVNEGKGKDDQISKLKEENTKAQKYQWMFWVAVVLGIGGIVATIKFL